MNAHDAGAEKGASTPRSDMSPVNRSSTRPDVQATISTRWAWAPEWARPREHERHGLGSLRLAETTLLILFALLLAIATADDVVKQTHVNHRLVADLATWRAYTGHDYHSIDVEQDIKEHSTRDVVCGNTTPGGPDERTQLCLRLSGPVMGTRPPRRRVSGGYYLPPRGEDLPRQRYGCFGSAVADGLCRR